MSAIRHGTWLLLFGTALAQGQGVHRCLDADGGRVYADRACSHLGLRPAQAPPPGLGRGLGDEAGTTLDVEASSGPVAAADGCPGATPDALREAVAAALAARDLNALTGMYYWAGAGARTAGTVIQQFQSLIAARPESVELWRVEVNDDWLWAGLPPPAESAPPELVVLAEGGAGQPLARFRLRPQAGCVWLSER